MIARGSSHGLLYASLLKAGLVRQREFMPYWSLCYHLVWATGERAPLIGPDLEADVWRAIRATAARADVHVYAVGGIPDHVHVAVSIPPTLAVADAVRRLKGGSSHAVNQISGHGGFGWQAEYGAITFAKRHLPQVTAYIQNQQRHHAEQSLWPVLERIASPD
jgi:putative transposase